MAVKDILDKSIIDLDMKAQDKDSVIRHLADLLYNAGYVSETNGLVNDVYVRESEGITGIGNHIAIPHAKSEYVKKVGLAIGKTKNMIQWESYDDEPVDLFFLFAVPADSENAKVHMKLLAEVAGKLGDEDIMAKLNKCQNYEELRDIFQ